MNTSLDTPAQPVDLTTWPEDAARVCFMCCALDSGRKAAKELTVGSKFRSAWAEYDARGLDPANARMRHMFTDGYVTVLKAYWPHGVPIDIDGRIAKADAPGCLRVIGVGLIG